MLQDRVSRETVLDFWPRFCLLLRSSKQVKGVTLVEEESKWDGPDSSEESYRLKATTGL